MLNNNISINSILISLESTLMIEADPDLKVAEVIDASVKRLENRYGCTFDRDIYTLQGENQLVADNLSLLLKDVQQCLSQLALYISLKLFHKDLGLSLADINYIGYDKESLRTALRYLQDEDQYKKYATEVITPLYNSLNNVSMCSIKRLFIILLMCDKLGLSEGVAVVAQLLYLGGLIV